MSKLHTIVSTMRFWVTTALVFTIFTLHAQQEGRIRTRSVDNEEYDRLILSLNYAANKDEAIRALFQFVDKNFTAEDEEYFNARFTAAGFVMGTGNYSYALQLYQEAINAYEKHHPFYSRWGSLIPSTSVAWVYLGINTVYKATHLYEKNIRYLESKRDYFENHEDPTVRQTFYADLGQSLYMAEQYEEAIKILLQLKQLVESGALDYKIQPADSIFKIDPTWPEETKQQIRKAKVQYEETMKKSNAYLLVTKRQAYTFPLANAYFKQYRFEECLPYAKQASEDMKVTFKFAQEATQGYNTTTLNASLPDSVLESIQIGNEYLRETEKIGGPSLPLVISAYKTNQQAMSKQYSTNLIERSVYQQLSKDFQGAEKSYAEVSAAVKKMKQLKGYSKMIDNYYSWVDSYHINLKVASNQLTPAQNMIRVLLDKEEKKLIKNFQYFTENEKKEFFKNYTKELDRYYSLLLLLTEKGNNQAGDLLNKILQTKGLILDATREQEKQLRKIKDKATLAQLAQVRKLRDKLAAFNQQFSSTQQPALADSINRITIRIGALEQSINLKLVPINLVKPIQWQHVQAKLKPGEAYLEIFRVQRDNFNYDKPKTQYWGIVVKPGDVNPALFQISESETFESRNLRNYQNRIRTQMEDFESYDTYWKRIHTAIAGSKTLYVSADGVYHVINPITLQNPATKKFVLDEVQIKHLSTGRDLLEENTPTTSAKGIVLVGNPRFDMSRKQRTNANAQQEVAPVEAEGTRSGIAQLPGTQKEVDLIQVMAATDGLVTELLIDNQANEANVKAIRNPAILHLATHGEFDQISKADTYLKSKLILAGAADSEPLLMTDYQLYEDGFLTAYEVTQLELSETRLVVLSACETGLGEIQSGEGVWGLQRAFQLAGVNTVMGSLWKISDEATVTYMEAFYKTYLANQDITLAYYAAMRATRQEYAHPYYWGAFTLTGSN